MKVFVGLEPILNQDLNEVFYELRYASHEIGDDKRESKCAAAGEIFNALVDVGLEKVVGNRLACIKVTREFITGEYSLPFAPDQILLEVPEYVQLDREIVDSLGDLAQAGFKIVLDNPTCAEDIDELLKIAHIVKVNFRAHELADLEDRLRLIRNYDTKTFVECIETHEDFEYCRDLGFDYFQGSFLTKPSVIHGQQIESNRLVLVQLLGKLSDPAIESEELERLISQDISLSFKILKYINSATFGIRNNVDSIQQAVTLLGLTRLKNIATLMALGQLTDKPAALLKGALLRAKLCELLAKEVAVVGTQSFYTVGLFSMLDSLVDMPLEQIIGELPLAEELKKAILNREGILGDALRCVQTYQRGDWSLVKFLTLDNSTISILYLEAVASVKRDMETLGMAGGSRSAGRSTVASA